MTLATLHHVKGMLTKDNMETIKFLVPVLRENRGISENIHNIIQFHQFIETQQLEHGFAKFYVDLFGRAKLILVKSYFEQLL